LQALLVTDIEHLSLPDDISLFYVQQVEGYPGAALSFYYKERDQDNDDTGKYFCHTIGRFIFL
jgi:hypothetical protein